MSSIPALRRLQRLWLLFVVILVIIGVSLLFVDLEPTSLPILLPAALAAAAGAAGVLAIVAIDRTFAATPPEHDLRALREFEARQALQFAVSLAPALLGFALAFVFGTVLAAAVGWSFALIALLRARPSEGRMGRIERVWGVAGHDVSALRAARAGSTATSTPADEHSDGQTHERALDADDGDAPTDADG
ncbi:MAG: hypothetical protein EA388_01260 [Nitriliruptor sp.]|nr:MAG: hypothetical protein EA388_01260 [Nitriliruptor sp.]